MQVRLPRGMLNWIEFGPTAAARADGSVSLPKENPCMPRGLKRGGSLAVAHGHSLLNPLAGLQSRTKIQKALEVSTSIEIASDS
jgi:hypothetical protein